MDQVLEHITTSNIVVGGQVTTGGNETSDYTSGITNSGEASDYNFVTLACGSCRTPRSRR